MNESPKIPSLVKDIKLNFPVIFMLCLKDLVDSHEKFIRMCVKERGSISPQIVTFRGNECEVAIVLAGRDVIKAMLDMAKKADVDWIVGIYECYTKATTVDDAKGYTHGQLEEMLKTGDKSVKDCVVLSIIGRDNQRLLISYEKVGDTIKKLYESTDFNGYLIPE